MCGIAGVMSSVLVKNEIEEFVDIATISNLRGRQGSGVFTVSSRVKNQAVAIHRSANSLAHLVTTEQFTKMHEKKSLSIICGHARWPTKGGTEMKMVHPHRVDHITGVHNGTMRSIMGKTIPTGESDSALVYKAIREHGLRKFVDESYGAYCLVWVDTEKGTLNFLRNDERPLWFCALYATGGALQTLYWASEPTFMSLVLRRNRGDITKYSQMYQLEKEQHFEYDLNVMADIGYTKKTDMKPVRTYPSYSGSSLWDGWEDSLDDGMSGASAISRNTGVNSGGVGSNSRPFQYTPPEHRARNGSIGRIGTVENIFSDMKRKAEEACRDVTVKKPERGLILVGGSDHAREDGADKPFRSELSKSEVLSYINSGPCVYCGDRPIATIGNGYPTIHPVKRAVGFRQYACDDCVDIDEVKHILA